MLLNLALVLEHVCISWVYTLDKADGLRSFLRNLDLAATNAVGDDVLSGGGTVLHVCDLGLSLGASFSYSLDCGNYFLLVLTR